MKNKAIYYEQTKTLIDRLAGKGRPEKGDTVDTQTPLARDASFYKSEQEDKTDFRSGNDIRREYE